MKQQQLPTASRLAGPSLLCLRLSLCSALFFSLSRRLWVRTLLQDSPLLDTAILAGRRKDKPKRPKGTLGPNATHHWAKSSSWTIHPLIGASPLGTGNTQCTMKEKKTLFFYKKRFRRASVKSAVAQNENKTKKQNTHAQTRTTGRAVRRSRVPRVSSWDDGLLGNEDWAAADSEQSYSTGKRMARRPGPALQHDTHYTCRLPPTSLCLPSAG